MARGNSSSQLNYEGKELQTQQNECDSATQDDKIWGAHMGEQMDGALSTLECVVMEVTA